MARFRQCFVDALKPKHLSSSWQINHRCAADTVQGYLCICMQTICLNIWKLGARSCLLT